jgi:hypothetical protein
LSNYDTLQTRTEAFERMLSTESNFNLLVDKILETVNGKLKDDTELKIAEKELHRIETSIENLIIAVENGFYSESTNARLKELENRKAELKANIVKMRGKEVKPITRNQVEEYLSYAIAQPSQNVIDLLVRKVIITDDAVDVYLKYSKDGNDDTPKRGRPKQNMKNPERNLSEQGFLFMSYTHYYYTNPRGRKNKFSIPKQMEKRDFLIHVII